MIKFNGITEDQDRWHQTYLGVIQSLIRQTPAKHSFSAEEMQDIIEHATHVSDESIARLNARRPIDDSDDTLTIDDPCGEIILPKTSVPIINNTPVIMQKKAVGCIVDWSQVPKGYDFVAVDADESIWAYANKPVYDYDQNRWCCDESEKYIQVVSTVLTYVGDINYNTAVFQRPMSQKPSLKYRDEPYRHHTEFGTVSIYWSEIPENFKYVAIDKEGSVTAFTKMPIISFNGGGVWLNGGNSDFKDIQDHVSYDLSVRWDNGYFTRPDGY